MRPAPARPVKEGIANPYYPALDGLRAVSVVMVMSWHVKGERGLTAFLPGWLGVDVFFLLSGFLITTLLLREQREKGRVNLRAFYLRRVFRILPIYLFVLGIYVALNAKRGGEEWIAMKAGLPYYLSFLNEFSKAPVFSFTWTLGVEEKFYLVWPLLGFVLFSRKRTGLFLVSYAIFLALDLVSYTFARSYSGLLLGCGLALLLEGGGAAWTKNALHRLPTAIPCLLFTGAALFTSRFAEGVFAFDIAALILIAHLVVRRSRLGSLLSSRVFVWVGRRSYSMYLLHGLAIGYLESRWTPSHTTARIGIWAVAVAVTAFLANATYLFIETPARNYGKRWIESREVRADSIAVESAS